MPCPLPNEDVSRPQVSRGFEELRTAETSKSDVSLGSEESSTLEETSVSEACPGPQEPSHVGFSVPEAEAESRHLPEQSVSGKAVDPALQAGPVPEEEQPSLTALGLLPRLHDPFAEVEAKLARLSSTVAAPEVPQADTARPPAQVADVTRDATWKVRQSSAGVGGAHVSPGAHRCPCGGLPLGGRPTGAGLRGSGNQKPCLADSGREGGMEIGGFARWAPGLLVEGHPPEGLAELPWLHCASRPEGGSRGRLGAAGRLLPFRDPPIWRGLLCPPVALLDAFSPFHSLSWFKFSFPSLPSVLRPLPSFLSFPVCVTKSIGL